MTVFDSKLFWLIVLAVTITLLYLLSPILTPFLLGALLAYIGDPFADRLEKYNLSRTTSVVIVFASMIILLTLIVLVLIPAINNQIDQLGSRMPQYLTWLKAHFGDTLQKLFDIDNKDFNIETLQNLLSKYIGSASDIAKSFLGSLKGPIGLLISLMTYLFLTPVVTFYLLRDWDTLVAKINELVPRQYRATFNELTRQSDLVLSGFMRGQMMVMLVLGIIYSVGLSIIGLDMAIVIGMFAGFVSFVPYLGLIVGITIAGIVALLQFQDWVHPLGVGMIFIIAQVIEGMILTPKFVGDRTGLHPVAVIFSVLAGGQLFGFLGVLLALPVTAVINVFLGHLKISYLKSDTYNEVTETSYKLPKEQYIHHEKQY